MDYRTICLVLGLLCLGGLILQLYSIYSTRIRRKDPFERLSYEQRKAVLRFILEKEIRHLGIEIPIEIIITSQLMVGTLGSYSPGANVIRINKNLLIADWPDGVELACVIAHEAFHAAQFQLVVQSSRGDLPGICPEDSAMIKRMRREFLHYSPVAEVGFKGYERQLIERQARAYEEYRKKYYRKHLSKVVSECLGRYSGNLQDEFRLVGEK